MSTGKKGAVTWTLTQYEDFMKRQGLSPNMHIEERGAENLPIERKTKVRRRKVMNKTEGHYARLLESQVIRKEIASFEFEGITLRWGREENISYTPDFAVFHTNGSIEFIEIKGGHIFDAGRDRFRHAKERWPQFRFSMWQKVKEGFVQIR